MANTKISALTANTNPTGNEELVYAYNNANGKMTLDTMKTFANTWQQEELVSWTNIKTINNQSLLWSWNIDIQWWWGSGWEWYDAIVDAAGNGDYTTIAAALADSKRKIFVMNGTYNETEWQFVTMSGLDKVIIHWQSRNGVVVNATLSSVETQWAEEKDYPALWFFDAHTTDNSEVDIRNMTFNFTVNSSQTECSLIRAYWKSAWVTDIIVDNCIFNVTNSWSARMYFLTLWKKNTPQGNIDITNCAYTIVSDTANMYLEAGTHSASNDMCVYKNCYFLSKANNSHKGRLDIRNAFDCKIYFDETNLNAVEFAWYNLDRCNIIAANIDSSAPLSVALNTINNCDIQFTHVWGFSPIKIDVSSAVPDWQSSTAYTVGDQVLYGQIFYQCKTSHTSSSSFLTDEDNWENIATIQIINATWNTIKTWETIELWEFIRGNTFDMSYDDGDILLPNHCIFEWNVLDDDTKSRNMYVNNHCILNWNIFWWYEYYNSTVIKYVSTNQNIITNNILQTTTNISKIGSGSAGVVDNNASWS